MMGTLVIAFILSVLAILCFLFCVSEFKTGKFWSGLGKFTLGLIFLVAAFFIVGIDFVEYGVGQIAEDAGPTKLKVHMPYAVKGAVEVTPDEIGAKKSSPHVVLLCAMYNKETSLGCDSSINWLAYRFRYLPPPYFLKLKDGTYKEISLDETKLLSETAR